MRCPNCGVRGYRRTTRTPEWRCRRCGHEWDITSDRPTIPSSPPPTVAEHGRNATERLAIPKGVLHFLNVILCPIVFAIVGGFVLAVLLPVHTVIRLLIGNVFANVFGALILVLAIGIGLYVAARVHEDVNYRIDENH